MPLNINTKLTYSLLLILVTNLSAAQSNFRHSLSFNAGMSLPIGKFSRDSPGEGHGFANPGFVYQLGFSFDREESRLNFLVGLSAILNPLDEKSYLAMYPEGVTIESRSHRLFGLSGGVGYDLMKSERVDWQVRAMLGVASIHYPSHETRYLRNNGSSALVYRTDEDNSVNLTGTIGSVVKCSVSPRIHLGGSIEFFRSRSNHEITVFTDTLPPNLQTINQEIAMMNLQAGVYYKL